MSVLTIADKYDNALYTVRAYKQHISRTTDPEAIAYYTSELLKYERAIKRYDKIMEVKSWKA